MEIGDGYCMIKINREILYKGFRSGCETTWELAKVIIPTAVLVALFKASGLLNWLAHAFGPYTRFLGLPGDAALVLFSGYFVNLYAAAGTIIALDLSLREITILSVMLGFCHSLLVELPISKKAGSSITYILLLRLGCSLLAGVILGGIL